MTLYKNDILHKWISAHVILLSFLSAIILGTFLLKLPLATNSAISWLDAAFTATSAVCVTGLIVVDTATKFTLFGKTIILLLIQLGGLGIMTFAVSIVWLLKHRVSLSERMILESSFLQEGGVPFSLKYFLSFLLKYTFTVELIGAFLYFITLNETDLWQRVLFAIFHSISAFCNAGFSLYSDSLIKYKTNIPVNLITMGLIILGGIGFLVVFEIRHKLLLYYSQKKRYTTPSLSLHSWTVITTSLILIILGTILIYVFQLLDVNKISFLEALFQSITCRTAGFNTINFSILSRSSLLIMTLLMFIGGSPGSTAGGIKTTTFAVLIFIMFLSRSSFEDVTARKRTIPKNIIYQALLIFLFAFFWILIVLILLATLQKGDTLMALLFETVSAFGTVGLSMGITSHLITPSKIIIIITMFIGRLGSLSIFSVFLSRKETWIKYAEENVLIG